MLRLVLLVLVALLPLCLGPALVPLSVALGGAPEHACACGMTPGTCGCPECALLAGLDAGLVTQMPAVDPTMRACDDHGRALASSPSSLGLLGLPSENPALALAPFAGRVVPRALSLPRPSPPLSRPPRPPRSCLV